MIVLDPNGEKMNLMDLLMCVYMVLKKMKR